MRIAFPPILRRPRLRLSLEWVLTVPFVVPMVGAVGLVSYLCYRNGQTTVDNLGHQLIAETNGRVIQEIRTYLQAPVIANQISVDSVQGGRAYLQNDAALEKMLLDRLNQYDSISAVLFASPEGQFRLVERLPEFYLGVADPPNPNRIQIYRLDQQGRRQELVATQTGLDVRRDRPWYQRAVTTGQPGWNPLFQYGDSDVLTLSTSQPVYDPTNNQLLGVFATHIRLDYLSQFLRTLEISRSGRILILDRNGTLIASSGDGPLYKIATDTDPLRTLETSEDALARSLSAYLPPASSFLEQPQLIDFRYNNEPYYGQATPLRDEHGLDWFIVTVVPKSHFTGTIQDQAQQTALLSLLTLILALAIGQTATRLLTRRFAQLHRASRELAAGNLDYHLETDSPIEEISSLAQAFNQMRDQLHQSFGRVKTALEESEAKFATIFQNSPDPMAIATLAEGRILEANESLAKFLGCSPAEIVGRTALELNLWHNLEERDRYRSLLRQQGHIRNLEAQLRTQAGAIKTVLLSAEILTLEGQERLMIGFRDISDRKASELALAQSEARYRATVNALPDLIIRMDRTGTYLDIKVTDAFPTIVSPQAIGKNIRDVMPEAFAQERMEIVQKVLQTGKMVMYEFPLQVQGQHLWQEARIVPLTSDEVLMMIRDLSQRKQAEEALRQSEARFRELAETVQQGFFVFETKTSRYSYLNPACVALTGLPVSSSPDEYPFAAGMYHWLNGIHPEDRDRVEAALQREHQGENFDEEYRFIHPDGEERWLRSKAFPLRDETGEITRIVGTVEDVTERRQAEEALRESEERFRQIAAHINQVFFVRSASTRKYLYVSPAYEKIWGRSCESLYQEPDSWLDTVHPEDLNNVLHYLSLQTQGHAIFHEYRIIRPEGSIRWIFTEVFSVFDEAGRPSRFIALAEDITERKQAEETLREREAMLRAIGDNLPKGYIYQKIHELGKQPIYTYISAGIERLLGIKPEDMLASPQASRTIGFEEDLAYADQMVQESLKNLTPLELQMRHQKPEGGIGWSSIRATPRRLANGQTVWDGIEVDITDLKQTEAALRASEELFRRAFDHAPIGISLVSPSGQFLKVNTYYCELLDYTEAELLTMHFQDITHPADLDIEMERLRQMLVGEANALQIEKRYITRQGTTIPVTGRAAPIRDQSGQVLYIVAHIQDIRDRLKVERMKDEFISVVSHELRTPLTSIQGALDILRSGVYSDRPERFNHMLEIAINNSERLERLVNDILNLERLESGKIVPMKATCPVTDLMRQAVESVQAIADQSNITLTWAPVPETLWADPDAIVQTLINLLSNAIKFSSPGDTVWLDAKRQSDATIPFNGTTPPCDYILFSIQDQGRGIPADKLETIFEEFQQVDVSDSRQKGGTGLGLAICKRHVQHHNGAIWVESILGEGSTFFVALPLREDG